MNVDIPSEEDSDAPEEITPPEKSKGKENDKGKEKQTKQTVSLEPPSKKQKLKSRQHSDDEVELENVDAPTTKSGRTPKKACWVMSNYTSPPTVGSKQSGSPAWRWQCKWCLAVRTSSRTKGITKYEDETIKLVIDSNFHSHLPKCNRMAAEASYEAFVAAEVAAKAGQAVPVVSGSSIVMQRGIMTNFIQEGIANPAVVVTKRGFASA
ncbi:hypothetical protein B0H10DRAFT_2219741 [Mycena sp. CBHHK59/15]|nr:hypothetical protein B0H10DRAFT_2219741 [Mycena sp. CBHHK59/15]